MRGITKILATFMLLFGLFAVPFQDAQANKNTLTIMVFSADWCGVCRSLEPTMERAIENAGDQVRFVEVDVDDHPNLTNQYGVEYVPMVLAIKDGETIDYFTGDATYSELVTFIDDALNAETSTGTST